MNNIYIFITFSDYLSDTNSDGPLLKVMFYVRDKFIPQYRDNNSKPTKDLMYGINQGVKQCIYKARQLDAAVKKFVLTPLCKDDSHTHVKLFVRVYGKVGSAHLDWIRIGLQEMAENNTLVDFAYVDPKGITLNPAGNCA